MKRRLNMNKKGKNLPVKISLGLTLVLTFLSGVDSIFLGLTKTSLIGKIIPSLPMMFIVYLIVGLSALITASVLAFKLFKR